MEKKIDISEILKYYPKGTKLYSPLCGECEFRRVYYRNGEICIEIKTNKEVIFCDKYGYYFYGINGEVIIFPSKENRDWSKFQRPFKDGDIIYTHTDALKCNLKSTFISIFKEYSDGKCRIYAAYSINTNSFYSHHSCNVDDIIEQRLATEEEKAKLFQAIKDNGYKWNSETKTLEKVIKPKFKVGDRIKHKETNKDVVYEISRVYDDSYGLVGFTWMIYMTYQDQYELVPNKFDITTLKPFDWVLVRDRNDEKWGINLFGYYNKSENQYYCIGFNDIGWDKCIPYKGNEHLLGKTDDCSKYYKTWE